MEQVGCIGPSGAIFRRKEGREQHALAPRAAVKAQFIEDAFEVIFDCGFRKMERLGDLGVRSARGGEPRDLKLKAGQTVVLRRGRGGLDGAQARDRVCGGCLAARLQRLREQRAEIVRMLGAEGYTDTEVREDLFGKPRMVCTRLK